MQTDSPKLDTHWVIDGHDLWAMLQRVAAGEHPVVVYADEYEKSERTPWEDL
jgi:hypothetical protein